MLREYRLENFKAFSGLEILPIRPITLIYGPNSAGKSSIIQSLMLLKQTLEESEDLETTLLPRGKLVDLGNFREFIHCHDVEKPLSISLKFKFDTSNLCTPEEYRKSTNIRDDKNVSEIVFDIYEFMYNQATDHPNFLMTLVFRWNLESSESELAKVIFGIGKDFAPIVDFIRVDGSLQLGQCYISHPFWTYWYEAYTKTLFEDRFISTVRQLLAKEELARIQTHREQWIPDLEQQKEEIENQLKPSSQAQIQEQISELKEQLSTERQRLSQLNDEFKSSSDYIEVNQNIEQITKSLKLLNIVIEYGDTVRIIENESGRVIYECRNLLEDKDKLLNRMDSNQVEMLLSYQRNKNDLLEWDRKREEEQSLIREVISDLENHIQELEKEIGKDKRIKKENQIDILEMLVKSCQDIDVYSLDKAVKDYKKVFNSTRFSISNFLIDKNYDFTENLSFLGRVEQEFWSGIYDGTEIFDLIFRQLLDTSDSIKNFLNSCNYLGPMREASERFYIYSGSGMKNVGKTGKGTADLLFKNKELLDKVNQFLEEFDIGYEMRVIPLESRRDDNDNYGLDTSDIYSVRLIDKYSGVSVSPCDVGFGISQVLPIIVQSLSDGDKTILIEQPELHIHPRLQTKLGSLLVESMQELKNRFIIETHSEHLMLRLQKLIRIGKFSHMDISVIYVDRNEEGSTCLHLRLDEEGDFIDEWPDGFFEEGFNEIF